MGLVKHICIDRLHCRSTKHIPFLKRLESDDLTTWGHETPGYVLQREKKEPIGSIPLLYLEALLSIYNETSVRPKATGPLKRPATAAISAETAKQNAEIPQANLTLNVSTTAAETK